jgi:transposase
MDEEIAEMDVAVGAAVAPLAPGQRWSLARKREVVLRLMQGEPAEGPSRRFGLPV